MTPEIGHWYAFCCIEDLYQITTPAERLEIREALDDDDGLPPRVWRTKEEALTELLPEASLHPFISPVTRERLGLTEEGGLT